MDFNHDAMGANDDGGKGKWMDEVSPSRCMARIKDDRKMGTCSYERDDRKVSGVAGGRLKGPDSPFTEDDI
jgi:hypothetical protein